jgi:hypothetical protein
LDVPSDLVSLSGYPQTFDDRVGELGGHVSTVSAVKCACHVRWLSPNVKQCPQMCSISWH